MAARLVLIGILAILGPPLATWTSGQAPGGSLPTGGTQDGKVIGYRALDLSQEQEEQIDVILQEARQEAAGAADVEARHEVWRVAMEKISARVLTEGQRQNLARLRGGGHDGYYSPATEPAAAGQ